MKTRTAGHGVLATLPLVLLLAGCGKPIDDATADGSASAQGTGAEAPSEASDVVSEPTGADPDSPTTPIGSSAQEPDRATEFDPESATDPLGVVTIDRRADGFGAFAVFLDPPDGVSAGALAHGLARAGDRCDRVENASLPITLSAGDALVLTGSDGTWGTAQRELAGGFVSYRTANATSEVPASLSIDIPGDAFPAIAADAFPAAIDPPTALSALLDRVLPLDSVLEWAAGEAGDRLQIDVLAQSGDDARNYTCTLDDDGRATLADPLAETLATARPTLRVLAAARWRYTTVFEDEATLVLTRRAEALPP